MTTSPEYVGDGMSLAEILTRFEAVGYDGQLAAREGGRLLCLTCRQDSPAEHVPLAGLVRTEGASDPADMLAVAAVTCPVCQAKGTAVLNYGPEAPLEDDEVLRLLDDRRTATGTFPTDAG